MMETQPPPNAAPPPPAEEALRSRKTSRALVAISIVGAVVLVIGLVGPLLIRTPTYGPYVQSLGNSRQVGLALMEFERDYGSFPSADTISRVKETTGTDLPLGPATSNDFFRQLLAAGIGNEAIFRARISGSKRPDEVITGSYALEKGECGFAYIPGLTSTHNTNTPVLITPLMPGTDKIDPKPFGGKAIILRIDGSAHEGIADNDGHLIVFGKRLLDPTNPIWGGKPPTLVWPE